MHINKNCMVMICALVNFSPWLRICSWLELRGNADVKLCSSGEGGTDSKALPVRTFMCDSDNDCWCMVDGSNALADL